MTDDDKPRRGLAGLKDRVAGGTLRKRAIEAAAGRVNALLDAVDAFEDRGGLSGLIDESLRNTTARARQITGDDKTLRQYYANLEVPFGSDRETVKKAYRNLLKRYHPDKHSGDPEREAMATRLTQELTRAYDAINAWHDRRRLPGGS